MIKIALTAKMRTGKDEFAKLLQKYSGKSHYQRIAFGDELKKKLSEVHGEEAAKDRKYQQNFGQSEREKDKDVWVKLAEKTFKEFKEQYPTDSIAVITDLRQPNEYVWALSNGFQIVRLESDLDIRIARMLQRGEEVKEEYLNHETEKYIDHFEVDYTVKNNSDFHNLKNEAIHLLNQIENNLKE